MFRSGGDRRGGSGSGSGADQEDAMMAEQDQMSDDDNAAPEMQSEAELEAEKEDPLLLAIDDLEGRVVAALDDVKLHPGVKTSNAPGAPSVYEELATLLRPVMEVAAHTAPSVARTYYRGVGAEGIEASCEDVYERLVSDLVLPVLLEMAQSETIPAKRGASLEFFRGLWKENHKAGSWLDITTSGQNQGPYGSGSLSNAAVQAQQTPTLRAQQQRRRAKRLAREGEILRYWVQASIACTLPGAFTSDASEGAVASRGIIAASASLRPSLKHIAQRIRDADDRGANRIFAPVMKMVEGVLKKLFLSTEAMGDSLRSACIKFLEIACMCCSVKPQDPQDSQKRKRGHTNDDFSLEDLPAGHPIITREALESIGEYAFSTLRGLTLLGGQVKIDINLLSDMMLSTGGNGSPSAQVVSILKPAALAFLEIESTLPKSDADDCLELNLDRSSIDFDFLLTQKSYALTVNAVSALAVNRPVFFKDGAVCLARRAADPPKVVEDGPLNKSGILTIQAAVRACSLTLLRNALSVTTNSWQILHKTLVNCDMEIQADKALTMARQTTALKTAGRAARNRANMFYEWEAGDQRTSKRQRETDDALAKMRAAKAARGLGHGIQLPTSMVDSIDLVLANLSHLPGKRPSSSSKTQRKTPFTLDFVFDAIMTNGASLAQEEGRWYSRDGGTAWSANLDSDTRYELSTKLLAATDDAAETKKDDQKKMFHSQCQTAAAEALGRIVTNGSNSRISNLSEFANQIAARLAWSMKGVVPSAHLQPSQDMAMETIQSAKNRLSDTDAEQSLDTLATSFPLVASCLALEATSTIPHKEESATGTTNVSLSKCLLNEAYAQACSARNREEEEDARWKYERSLEVFVGSMVHASERANDKPNDSDRKRVATQIAATMQRDLAVLPRLTPSALTLISAMCDIDDITKKAAEAGRKQSQQTIAASASLNAAKQAAEKRATAALLALRDAAFQRSDPETRRSAVGSAVGLAAGRLPASASCEDKALKLVMNVLFAKSESLANNVVDGATSELKRASDFAVEKYNQIQVANREAVAKEANTEHQQQKAPFAPDSDEEKQAMEKVRKPAVLFMALCVRRPEIIKTLFKLSSVEHADVLSKAVRQNMSKLARAAGTKHGAAPIALKVAEMTETAELPLLLAFLDNLAPGGEKNIPSDDFIEACHKIQETKAASTGLKEVRFLIPVVSAMKRDELVAKLPEFVDAEDKIFLAALERMADRNGRHALLFRDEPDPENPSLKGMTLCEQLVFLHQLDFAAAGLPQKRYLDAIRLCLDNDELFNDRLVMSALDHMSGSFLTGVDKLPLAYMRTIILVCSKHESLHNWICHILLPRLVEGKIYTDRRQWEGWMRCAKMLENSGDPGGSSSLEAINKLPPEQLGMYHARYGNSE